MQPDKRWTRGSSCSLASEGLHETVARTALSRGDAIALRSAQRTTTYAELDSTAGAWAAELAGAGAGPGDLVPVVLAKSHDLVCALLAVLKTGAAYALLDPAWPASRLREMVRQLEAPVSVAEPGSAVDSGSITWAPPHGPAGAPAGFEAARVDGSHPCCVFFTSGTTGRPKGVLTPHRATARLFQPETFAAFDSGTVMPLAAPMPWDAFSLELWSVLLRGGTSVLVDEPYLSSQSLRNSVSQHGVNTLWLTSSLFNMVVDEDLDAFRGVRQVMAGGERLSPAHVARFLRRHPSIALLNGYGPVESTVFATTHRITPADCERSGGIPLGRPVPGTQLYVLDGARPCAVGETGEICIAGDGLALRYVGDPEQTEAKFPVVELDGTPVRIYKTGDLGAWEEDGLLRFRGRADRQMKIRGHRVEPAEIETEVERVLPAVRTCRILGRRDELGAVDGLVAFCVPARAGDPLDGAFDSLQHALVPHHRPVAVVSVEGFPVTEHGKLDERALLALVPRPETSTTDAGGDGRRSGDPMIRLVAETFGAVLGSEAVPADVAFSALGGSSLAAGRVCARLADRLGRPVPVSWIYEHPTTAGFAARLSAAAQPHRQAGVTEPGTVPLTPMQLVFLMRHLVDPGDRTGHCLLTWEIRGDLARDALESAIADVHRLHEPLRAAYLADPKPAAHLTDVPPPRLELLSPQPSRDAAARALRAELARGLEPMEGQVWRAALAPVGDGSVSVFACIVHHIAFDGWSEAVLSADLAAAYNAARGTDGATRPPPPSLAAAYRSHAQRWAGGELDAQRRYLIEQIADVPDLNWSTACRGRDESAGQLEFRLERDVLAAAEELAAATGVTLFVVLLSAWARGMGDVTGQRDFAVGVPVAQRYGAAMERAVGCHINMLCIRLRGPALEAGPAALRAMGALVGRAMAAQDVPVTDLLRAVPRHNGRPPLYQTLFALQNAAAARLELTGLRTTFIRQPYLDLPLELHAEVWPEEAGGLRLVVSRRAGAVCKSVARECGELFSRHLEANLPERVS